MRPQTSSPSLKDDFVVVTDNNKSTESPLPSIDGDTYFEHKHKDSEPGKILLSIKKTFLWKLVSYKRGFY